MSIKGDRPAIAVLTLLASGVLVFGWAVVAERRPDRDPGAVSTSGSQAPTADQAAAAADEAAAARGTPGDPARGGEVTDQELAPAAAAPPLGSVPPPAPATVKGPAGGAPLPCPAPDQVTTALTGVSSSPPANFEVEVQIAGRTSNRTATDLTLRFATLELYDGNGDPVDDVIVPLSGLVPAGTDLAWSVTTTVAGDTPTTTGTATVIEYEWASPFTSCPGSRPRESPADVEPVETTG